MKAPSVDRTSGINSYNGGAIVAEKKIFDARQQNYLKKLIPACAHVRMGLGFHGDRPGVIPAVNSGVYSALASCAEVDRLTSRSAIFGSRRTRMAAMTGVSMGRGCCLQYSWSMFAGPGSQ